MAKDLRPELVDRLQTLGKRREAAKLTYEREIKTIAEEEVPLRSLLQMEERRLGARATALATPTMPLLEFLRQQLESDSKTLEQLVEAATKEGYFEGLGADQSAKRVTHMTLVNDLGKGRIHRRRDGTLELAKEAHRIS
jgi:hypothetical protein